MKATSNTLLIVDGNALLHRAYHALPVFKTMNGVPTNALYGFVTMLDTSIHEFHATHVIVCFDTKEKTFRDDLFPQYRTQRPDTDEDLIKQFPMARTFLDAAHITYIEQDGFEADDLIATIATKLKNDNIIKLILTGDKDIFQLIDKKHQIFVLTPQTGFQKHKLYDDDAVRERFGIDPNQIPDFKALAGDPSDNYKGVAGIGPKTASALINQFQSVENIYERVEEVANPSQKAKLLHDKENALLSKQLALLVCDMDIECNLHSLEFNEYHDDLKAFFDEYEFNSLKRRFFEGLDTNGFKDVEKKVSEKKVTKKKNENQIGLF